MKLNRCPNMEDGICSKDSKICGKQKCIFLKQAMNAFKATISNQCDRCDGIGYPECQDLSCGYRFAISFIQELDVTIEDEDWYEINKDSNI